MSVAADASSSAGAAAAVPAGTKLAPFNPTSVDGQDLIFGLAGLSADDLLVDIGCGDGKVLERAAVNHGCRAVGFDYDAAHVERGRARIAALPPSVAGRIEMHVVDATAVDFVSEISTRLGGTASSPSPDLRRAVVFCYLVPAGLEAMKPVLRRLLDAGARVATNMFSVKGWDAEPDAILHTTAVTPHKLSVHCYQRKEPAAAAAPPIAIASP